MSLKPPTGGSDALDDSLKPPTEFIEETTVVIAEETSLSSPTADEEDPSLKPPTP